MIFLKLIKETDFGLFSVVAEGTELYVTVRVYAFCEECEYAGIPEAKNGICNLEYSCKANIKRILITDGRIEDNYKLLCEFIIEQDNTEVSELEISMDLCNCLSYYGHYVMFVIGDNKIYAFPSDFYTHPLTGYMEFAYWYDIDLGFGMRGYYFIGFDSSNHPFFVDNDVLTEVADNCKI